MLMFSCFEDEEQKYRITQKGGGVKLWQIAVNHLIVVYKTTSVFYCHVLHENAARCIAVVRGYQNMKMFGVLPLMEQKGNVILWMHRL